MVLYYTQTRRHVIPLSYSNQALIYSVKSIIVFISQPKRTLWVLKRTVFCRPKCMLKLTDNLTFSCFVYLDLCLLHLVKPAFFMSWYRYITIIMRGSREGSRGSGPPWKITKLLGCLAKLDQIPWTITKLPSQHSLLGHHRPVSETPFKWCFASRPLMAYL